MEEILIFTNATANEQQSRLKGFVMDVEPYWSIRLGTSAVGVCLAVVEYGASLIILPDISLNRTDMLTSPDCKSPRDGSRSLKMHNRKPILLYPCKMFQIVKLNLGSATRSY